MLDSDIRRPDETGELDFRSIFVIARRRFWAMLAAALLVLGAASIYTARQTEFYTAQSSIVLEVRQSQVIDIDALVSGASADSATIATELEVLRSRSLAGAVVDVLSLVNYPEFNPSLAEPAAAGGLVSAVRGVVRAFLPQQVTPVSDEPSVDPALIREAAVSRVVGGLAVQRLGNTYIINISFTSLSPRMAQDVANAYAEAYLNSRLEGRFEATERASDWLQQRVDALRDDVRMRERAVVDYRESADLIDMGGSTLAEQQVADLNSQLAVQRADLSEVTARLDSVRTQLAQGVSPDAIGPIINSEVVQSLRNQEAQIRARLVELSGRYGDRHPEVVTANRELADVEAQIDRSIARIITNFEGDVAGARERVRSLAASLARARAELAENNSALVRMRELEREAEAARALFANFLSRFREASEAETLVEADARIIAPARLPGSPSSPDHERNMLIGLVLAALAAASVATLLEIFDSGLRSDTDIERQLGLPHVASIPNLQPGLLARMAGRRIDPVGYVVDKPLSSFAESLRTVRSAIRLSAIDRPSQVIAISSAVPGDGKTTLTIGLGRVSAMAGTKTLVIDCDLRRRLLTKALCPDRSKQGLLEVLSGSAKLEDVIASDDRSDLDVLPIAEATFTPRDVFGTQAFAALIAELRKSYDQIIIDTAPILAVADTRAIAAQVDGVLLAAQWRKSSVTLVRRAAAELRAGKGVILGVVLNNVDLKAQARYGYGDAGAYYRTYQKYYAD